ncbi:hypothetical protein Tco_1200331 [Tanacetum coccineum]
MLTKDMAKELSATSAHECLFIDFLSQEEPKKVSEALKHSGWVDAMQEELNQFAINKVWTLVPAPYGKTIITKNRYRITHGFGSRIDDDIMARFSSSITTWSLLSLRFKRWLAYFQGKLIVNMFNHLHVPLKRKCSQVAYLQMTLLDDYKKGKKIRDL